MSGGIIDLVSFLQGGPTGTVEAPPTYTPLVYPISRPSVAGIREIIWGRDEVRSVSESPFSLHRTVYQHTGERWRVQIGLPPMTRAQAMEWEAFLLLLNGGAGEMLFGDPSRASPRGLAYGAPTVDGASQTGRTLVTQGWSGNVTGILKAGDFIQLGTRLHVVTRDASSDDDGRATLDIWPRLRETPSDEQGIVTQNCRGVFRLAAPGGALSQTDYSTTYQLPAISLVESL